MNEITSVDVRLNPYGNAPLAAIATVETRAPATIEWRLHGKDGRPSGVRRTTATCASRHEFEIFGLYADHANKITVEAMNADGSRTA